MTKGRMALRFSVVVGGENCRSLGFARDDKGEDGASVQCGCWWRSRYLRNKLVIACVFVASGSCAPKSTGNFRYPHKPL
jgi:hypothetical protein